MESIKDTITHFILLFFIVLIIGWLVYNHTGQDSNQLSPDFWAGAALPILIQIIRKTFDLKSPNVPEKRSAASLDNKRTD